MLSHRLPDVTEHIMGTLAEEGGGEGCLTELCTARKLDRCGFARPDWAELKDGLRPPPPASVEAESCVVPL